MSKDTANQIASLDECLDSIGKKLEIAKILYRQKRLDLFPTIWEELFRSIQLVLDNWCVKEK